MQYDIFQQSPDPPRWCGLSKFLRARERSCDFSSWELLILIPFVAMVFSVFLVAGWSAVLLVTGNTAGGGPIGLAARLIFHITW